MGSRWLQRVFNWNNFYQLIWRQITFFAFLLGLFCLFRVLFIIVMHDYISSEVIMEDVFISLVYGIKLSLKSAGILTALAFGVDVLCYLLMPQFMRISHKLMMGGYVLVLTGLFCGRIPYYEQFHSGYNQLIFNTFNDDVYALVISLIEQFHLPLRLFIAFGLAVLLYKIYIYITYWPILHLPVYRHFVLNWLLRGVMLMLLYQGMIFVSFGGSMSYAGNVDWENSGITKDNLLNEAILDDVQALYRAYEMNGRMESSTGLAFSPEDIRGYAAQLTGKQLNSGHLIDYLEKHAAGAVQQPRHIFLIVGESYANWPLLPKYQNLHLADGVKKIGQRPDAVYVDNFLPNGMSTISAVMGIVTGLADANLYLTTMPEAYTKPYVTAIAPQLKRMGYQTHFWYAGPTSWERVKDFSLAQGFDAFYGSGDYSGVTGNVWGCDDEFLYKAVLGGISADVASFNLILTVSNHSPFSVDLVAAGFPEEEIKAALPAKVRDDKELIKQLGHFWYSDKMLAEFVQVVQQKYPDSLFIIVGDHADRVNIDKTPSLYERYGVPLVVCGAGVNKNIFPAGVTGSHIDILPTLIELAAPQDFCYYSVGKSLTKGNNMGVNYGFWTADGVIGRTDEPFAPEAIKPNAVMPDPIAVQAYIEAVRSISWWYGKYGSEFSK